MTTTTRKPPRVIQFAEIEQRFELVASNITRPPHPAVTRNTRGGYSIRILVAASFTYGGNRTEKYDYFYCDADGTINTAPRGYAKDYRPGRIPVEELDAAVERYAAVTR